MVEFQAWPNVLEFITLHPSVKANLNPLLTAEFSPEVNCYITPKQLFHKCFNVGLSYLAALKSLRTGKQLSDVLLMK